jgi:flagellar FliL protein
MSDDDDMGISGDSSVDSGSKKSSGLAGLIPKLLKFIAIGLGALIFIVTVAVITFNFLNKGGRSQTVVSSESDPYVGRRPEYTYYTNIDLIRTFTNDPTPASVVVKVVLGYDMNDRLAPTELTNRQYEITAFVRQFFALKTADELKPEDEAQLLQEIREALNTRILQTTKIRSVLFQQLDVIQM